MPAGLVILASLVHFHLTTYGLFFCDAWLALELAVFQQCEYFTVESYCMARNFLGVCVCASVFFCIFAYSQSSPSENSGGQLSRQLYLRPPLQNPF